MRDKHKATKHLLLCSLLLLVGVTLLGCAKSAEEAQVSAETAPSDHTMATSDTHSPELTMASPIALNLARGSAIGPIYEAFLSPHQEGGEEEDTPDLAPDVFKSTAPSVPRNQRTSHGHGVLSFTNDLSRAYVHVAVENVNPDDIVMFHIHCGRPGQLGPIIIDFGLRGNHVDYFADGTFALEITNADIEANLAHGEGVVGAFTAGCPIVATLPLDKVKTIGGLQFIAEQGELYFNMHTKGQTFYGDIRGQLQRVDGSAGN